MRFILLACALLVLPNPALPESLKMTAPQEGKGLGNLQHRKTDAAPATIDELFARNPAVKSPAPAKADAAAILRDIDAKLDALQLQVDKLGGAGDAADEKLLAVIDRLNTLSASLAALRKEPPEAAGGIDAAGADKN